MDNLKQLLMNSMSQQPAQNNYQQTVPQQSAPQQNAYRQNLQQLLTPPQNDQMNLRELYGVASRAMDWNPQMANLLIDDINNSMSDPQSYLYNPYNQPTNRAVSNLAAYGFDTNNLTDDWFNQNNGWIASNLLYNGTTNSPSKPGKKATRDQLIAYELYQYQKSEGATRKAEQQWDALQQELTYLAQDKSRNYSDEDILKKIDWSKYKELTSMDDNKYYQPNEYNRAIGYSKDAMYGVLWKARNPEYNGDMFGAMANSAMGNGNVWNDNPEISAKLNWNNADTYSPFSVGMTAGEEGRYFGVYSFGEKEIERLQNRLDPKTGEPLDPNDATAMKMRDNVLAANETTNQAKRELGVFQKKLDEKLKDVTDPEEAQKIVEDLLDSEVYDKETKESITFDTLKKMDASLNGSPDSLVKTTDAVDYRKQDMVKYALDRINANAEKETGTDVQDDIAGYQGGATAGNPEEGAVPAVAKTTETETSIAAAQDSELKEVKAAIYDDAGEMEQAVMDNGWSVTYDGVKNAWDNIVNYGRTFVDNLASKVKDSVLSDHTESTLSTLQSMFDYDMRTENIQRMELRRDELQKKYGNALLIGQEPESEVSKTITVDGEKYQIFLSNIYTEDGSYMLDAADQFYNGDTYGIRDEETWNKILASDEYRKAVEEASANAQAITKANEDINKPYFTDEYRAEVQAAAEELRSLDLQIENAKLANAQDEQQYQKDQKAFDAAQRKLDQQIYVMGMLGMDTSDLVEYQDTIAYLTNFSNYEATVWSAYNPNDMYRFALAEGEDMDAIFEAAKRGNDQIVSELETARARKKYIEDHGLNVPGNYLNNLDRHIAKLERDVQDYEDFLLSKNEDWDEMVAKGKQEEYDTRPQQWSLIHNPELDYNQEEYYAHMDEDVSEEYSAFANHGLRGISGIFTGQMTQQEKDTYYYLMGKGEKERAREYVESLIDMSYGVLHTRLTNEVREKTEGMLREEKSQDFATKEEADKWVEQNGEKFKDYQVTKDENGYHISWSQSTGAGAFIGTNLLAVLAAPGAAMASLGYMGYSLFTGNELNPDNVFLAANTFRSTTREQSAKEIADYYGEGTVMQKAVQMFYEMVSNRLDSAMMGFTVGGLGSGIGNEMLQEFVGASPMGFSAAMDAMMEAKRKGASDAQAWGIGFVTFIAETGTEAISLDNMKKAFKLGEEVTGEGIKAFLKEWLTQGGISEMLGESANDVIENLADELIMGELSDHKDRVWAYRMQNYSKEDAEAMARRDEIAGVLRTAFMSYLSPGMDIVSYGVGRADYYRQRAKQLQKVGINTSTVQVAKAEREARIEEQRAADEALNDELRSFDLDAVDEELARREARDREADQQEDADIDASQLQSKTNPEQTATPAESAKVDIGTQYNALESVRNADTSSQSATISSVLDTAKTEESADMANAATMKLGEMLGEGVNAAEFVQDMLLGADVEGVEAAPLMQAIQNASLGGESSAAWQLMQTEEFKNADYGEQAAMLAGTVEIDSANQAVAQQIGNSVHDYLVVQAEKEILKNGTLDSVKQAQEKVAQAARNLQMAQESLEEKQGELHAKGEALQAATEEFNQNPTADNQHALDRALNEYNRADIVEREYQQHLDNVQRANEEAKVAAKSAQEAVLRDIRQQAEAVVADQMQQRQERAARAAEQQRIDAEIAEKAAKAAREFSNFARLNAEDVVSELFPNVSEEDRKRAIDIVMDVQEEMSQSAESWLKRGDFAKAFAKRFDINNVQIVQNAPFNARINTATGELQISSNATQSDIMYAVMIHEITHMAEQSETYKELADTVLQARYGEGVTFDSILSAMEDGDVSFRVAQDILGKKAIYDNYYKQNGQNKSHTNEEMLQEIVADAVGYTIAGDEEALNRLVAEKPSLAMRILESIRSFLRKAVGMEDETISQAQKVVDLLETALKNTEQKSGEIKYSFDNGIEPGMTDMDRYNSLVGTVINSPVVTNEMFTDQDYQYFASLKTPSEQETALRKRANDLGLVSSDAQAVPQMLTNNHIDMEARFSNASIKESVNKQNSNPALFAALMSKMRETFAEAIPVLVEGDRYQYTVEKSTDINSFISLLGAFEYNGSTIPVLFDVKNYKNNTNGLYIVVTIKGDPMTAPTDIFDQNDHGRLDADSASSVSNSIEDIISFVNKDDEAILSVVPSQFLTDEQKEGKRNALEKQGEGIRNAAGEENADAPIKMTTKRINKAISDYNGNAYITYIDPSDFVSLSENNPENIADESRQLIASELRESETPYLLFDPETGEVVGGEGSHRMTALANAGAKQVAILMIPTNGNSNPQTIDNMNVFGKNGSNANLTNLIPAIKSNKKRLLDNYARGDQWFRYSLPSEDIMRQQIRNRLENGPAEALPGMLNNGEGGNAQRQFGRKTAQESNALHDDVKTYLYNHSAYTPDTNSAQIDRAISWVQSNASQSDPDGFFSSLQKAQNGDFDSISADGQARMLTLMGMAALKGEETGDHSSELMLADLFNKQGTEAGRALQARKMFRLMTPIGRMATLNKMADQINEEYGKKGNKRRVRLSDWTLQAAAVAESEEDFQKVQKAAAAELASQMPANWKEKFTAIRMLSMLGNVRTHGRNLVGNLAFMPAVGLKNKIGAGLEAAFVKKGDRTKTIGLATPESRAFAKQYAKEIEGLLRGESKYNEGGAVQQERKMFGQGNGILSKTLGRATQWLIDVNGNALEAEDWIFLNRHFRNAFAGYMTANGLTEADMKGDTLDKATAYAVSEAQKATYRDANEIADWMNKVKNPAAKFVINAVLPFKKTPMNILKRGVEYSPVSIIRSLTSDAKHLKQWNAYQRGELSVLPEKAISPAQYIDRAASGLSGTLIVGLGALLSSLGFVRGGMDDDDDEFDKLNGSQEYSLEIGGVSFTIDWAAPICMPLFVGATVMEEAKKAASGRGEGVSIGSVLDSILGIAEPVTQLSMLDGLNSVLNPSNYGDTDSLIQVGEKVITNYATSYVPTLLGQAARTIDTTRRRNFVESGADLKVFRSALEQVENKIPFLSQKNIPYRNVWGEADVSPQGWAAIENFLSPGYGNTLKNDPVTNELKRIYQKTRNPSMIPKAAGKTVTVNGKNAPLTAEQYDQYVVDRGQTAYNCIKDLMESPVWQICDDNTRALMITDAWNYANQIGRHNVDNRIKKDSWVANAEHNGNFVDVAIERAADSNRTDYIKGYGQTMAEAMDSNDSEMFDLSVTALEEAGATEAEIRGSLRDYFKPLYQIAFEENDTNTMDLIEEKLLDVGVGFKGKDIAGWIPSEAKEKEIDQRWLNMEEDNQ